MAQVANNLVTQGLTGKLGNLVFRRRGNKTSVYLLSPRKALPSEKQKEAQLRFAEAVLQAKQVLADAAERQKFEELAREEGKESAYCAAIAYFCVHRNSDWI